MKKTSAFYALCVVGGLAIFSSTIAKNPVLPILAQEIGAGKALIGLIAAASTVTVMIGSGVVFFTAPLCYFLVREPWQLALVRVYHGLATAVFGPVAMAFVADLAPTRRGERLGYYSSSTLIGRALAPVVGGAILAATIWQGVYVACAVAGALALAGMFLLPDTLSVPSAQDEPIGERAPLRCILADRNILVTSVAEAAQFLAFGALEAFLPLYALSVDVSKAAVGLLFGVQVGVRTLARPLMGILSDRYGRKGPIVAGLLVTAAATVLFAQVRSWLLLLSLSVVFGIGLSVASAATSAFVADLAPTASRGAALGFMSTIMDVGQASGPVLLGAVLETASYQWGFAVVGGLVLAAALSFSLVARPALQPARAG
jgi:MFS family permease